jgi:hypothetical protein
MKTILSQSFFDRIHGKLLKIYSSPLSYLVIAAMAFYVGYNVFAIATVLAAFVCLPVVKKHLPETPPRLPKIVVVFLPFISAFLGALSSRPAQAQFFTKTKNLITSFVASSGGAGSGVTTSTQFIESVILFFQAILALYVIVGIIMTFNSMRNGDEWKDTAKMPMFVLLAGVVGDQIVGVISGK